MRNKFLALAVLMSTLLLTYPGLTRAGFTDVASSHSNFDAIDLDPLNDNVQIGNVIGDPGSWSAVIVPEPSTGLLVSLGLLGLAPSRRSR